MDLNNAYAPPQPAAVVAPDDPMLIEARALRVAGGLLLAGALVNAISTIALNTTAVRATYSSGWMSILFDLWIGGSLVAGRFRVRTWAIIRASLGALLFGGGALVGGNVASGVITLVSCGAILLLVVPRATRLRTIVGAAAYGLVLLLSIVGLAFAGRG